MSIKVVVKNKRASYDFELLEKLEAGLVLVGTEVKSLREGKGKIDDAFISIDQKGEAWIYNMTIPHYAFGNINNHEETRKRKLLLQKNQIEELSDQVKKGALTIVPTMVYFKKSKVKLEIALAKGKKLYDKRAASAKKDIERKIRQGNYE